MTEITEITEIAEFHDEPVAPGRTATDALPDRFFDRFMFNAHPVDRTAPSILLGCGLYPTRNVIDGFAIVVTEAEQRNLRWSTELDTTDWRGGGPFRFEVLEANRAWCLVLDDNPSGLAFALTWRARTPAWVGDIDVHNSDDGTPTRFEHLVQSGFHHGTLTVDGVTTTVDGWYGQRDRSRGVRTMSGGQGLHIWFQAQFPDRSVGFLLVEDRHGGRVLLEGAVMHADGSGADADAGDGGLDAIIDVRHDLRFGDDLDLQSGTVEVTTGAGRTYVIDCEASAGGGFMAGGGYDAQHGRERGRAGPPRARGLPARRHCFAALAEHGADRPADRFHLGPYGGHRHLRVRPQPQPVVRLPADAAAARALTTAEYPPSRWLAGPGRQPVDTTHSPA